MTPDEARTTVLCKYPDAEPHADDYNHHWIGRKVLSTSFEENWDKLDEIDNDMPRETHEQIMACIDARKAVEQEAEDKAWIDAAQKILKENL